MSTKKKILTAAAQEFAMKGYNGTTVRDICKRAKANVASVNYHFKSKESLYKEMFAFLFSEIEGEDVLDKPWDGSFKSWRSTMKKWVESILRNIISTGFLPQCKRMIFGRELLDPSEIFPNIYETFMRPRIQSLTSHFRKVMPDSPEDEIYIRAFSVISSCLFYFHDREIIKMSFPGRDFTMDNFDKIVDHITEKACSGLEKKKALSKVL